MELEEHEEMLEFACDEYASGNFKSALKCFEVLARAGDSIAQNYLGVMHEMGEGTPCNETTALYWYRKAVRQGDLSAMQNIGQYYWKQGKVSRARFWIGKMIQCGDGEAALSMAKILLTRVRSPKGILNNETVEEARRFLEMAVQAGKRGEMTTFGYKEARDLLKQLQKNPEPQNREYSLI